LYSGIEQVCENAIAYSQKEFSIIEVARPALRIIGNRLNCHFVFPKETTQMAIQCLQNADLIKDAFWVLSLIAKYDAQTIVNDVNFDILNTYILKEAQFPVKKEYSIFINNLSSIDSGKYWEYLLSKGVLTVMAELINPIDTIMCTIVLTYIVNSLINYPTYKLQILNTNTHIIEDLSLHAKNTYISELCHQLSKILKSSKYL